MPPQLTQDQREQITAALFRREDAKEIADANGISERQVRRIAQNLKQYGTVTAPRLKKMGRPTCLNKEIEDVGALSTLFAETANSWYILMSFYGVGPSQLCLRPAPCPPRRHANTYPEDVQRQV
jgi:hypothetical protein